MSRLTMSYSGVKGKIRPENGKLSLIVKGDVKNITPILGNYELGTCNERKKTMEIILTPSVQIKVTFINYPNNKQPPRAYYFTWIEEKQIRYCKE